MRTILKKFALKLVILNRWGAVAKKILSNRDAGNLNIYSLHSSFVLKKPPSDGRLAWVTWVWVEFIESSIGLVLNFDSQFRRLDIDGFNGLTDDTSNGVEHLGCGLQLALFQSLMKQLGPHVLETSEHIFAIIFPVFINQQLLQLPNRAKQF